MAKDSVGIGVGIGSVLVLVMLFSAMNSKQPISPHPETPKQKLANNSVDVAGLEKSLRDLVEEGLITRIDAANGAVYVNAPMWAQLDIQQKEQLGKIAAFYCGAKRGTNLNWAEIYDTRSGKKLAKYSEAWGFKTY